MERPAHAPFATVKQVAEFLGLHPETVRILARTGEFPNADKRGRGAPIYIPWSEVERFADRGQPDATVSEVAVALALHPGTVSVLLNRGAFPNAYKTCPGRRNNRRIPWSDVENYRKRQPRVSQ